MFITYKYVCFNFFTFYSLPLFVDRQDLSIALNDVKCLKKKKKWIMNSLTILIYFSSRKLKIFRRSKFEKHQVKTE